MNVCMNGVFLLLEHVHSRKKDVRRDDLLPKKEGGRSDQKKKKMELGIHLVSR